MTIHELNADQLRELKERYLCDLANEGDYAEVMDTDHDEPSYWDLAHADQLVPDDVLYRQWEGYEFNEEDFSSTTN